MTIGKKIFGGYLLVLLFTLLVTVAALYMNRTTRESYRRFLDVNQQLMAGARDLRAAVLMEVEGFRGYLLYGEEESLAPWRQGQQDFQREMEQMLRLAENEEDRAILLEIQELNTKYVGAQDEAIQIRRRQGDRAAREFARSNPYRDELLGRLPAFVKRQEQALEDGRQALSARVNLVFTVMLVVALAALLSGVVSALLLTRGISRQLQDSVSQITSSSAEILATTSQVASGAAETASSVSETTTTVEEVRQTAQLSSQKARYVSETAQKATQTSQRGKEVVTEAVDSMHRLKEQMEAMTETVVRLSEQGQAIGEIMTAVNDLADQSNLLAVNAAIEAAKAGEQGKGFSVVAQEVRSLAEQSKQASAQVRGILSDVQKATATAVMTTERGMKAVESAVRLAADAGEAIRGLGESIGESSQAATQIAASSQQQLVGMDQIAQAMESIRLASAQNVAGTRQAEQAAHDLNALAARLRTMVAGNRNGSASQGAAGPEGRERARRMRAEVP